MKYVKSGRIECPGVELDEVGGWHVYKPEGKHINVDLTGLLELIEVKELFTADGSSALKNKFEARGTLVSDMPGQIDLFIDWLMKLNLQLRLAGIESAVGVDGKKGGSGGLILTIPPGSSRCFLSAKMTTNLLDYAHGGLRTFDQRSTCLDAIN